MGGATVAVVVVAEGSGGGGGGGSRGLGRSGSGGRNLGRGTSGNLGRGGDRSGSGSLGRGGGGGGGLGRGGGRSLEEAAGGEELPSVAREGGMEAGVDGVDGDAAVPIEEPDVGANDGVDMANDILAGEVEGDVIRLKVASGGDDVRPDEARRGGGGVNYSARC